MPDIDILCANTPQAKGRVERANRTLQDRLVKEFRLKGVSTIAAGNAALPGFVAAYNARFAVPARDGRDAHRPLGPADDMDTAFSWQVARTVSQSLTLQYDKVLYVTFNKLQQVSQGSRWRTRTWTRPSPLSGRRGG